MNQIPDSIELPSAGKWAEPADVEAWALACLIALGLSDWSFGWDRAVRRLGCCSYTRRRITLSRHYVAAYLLKNADMVRRTVLHELAHALTMVRHHKSGHGRLWQQYCTLLGIAGEQASCKCDDFTPAHYRARKIRYVLCHRQTGEIFRRYTVKPRKNARSLARTYIVGRKEETLGQLILRCVDEPSAGK